ncbi:hypothetical protein ACGTNG_14905 [Halomonas sp. 1390]|uniref:hypothetical protein n=1 Tax=Halomonas sp. B23F22_3 TaxID=3459516 RepID=UPI00373EF126
MTYLLVMGGLALSVCFTLGWGMVGMGRWLARRLPGGGGAASRQKARRAPNRPKAAARPSAKTPPKARTKASDTGNRRSTMATPPSEPWRLTRWLARRRSSLPLGLLALLLYGGSRLAEYGMAFRPHEVPGEFHRLVEALGWSAAVLLALATVSLLAAWRCRR